MPFKYGHEGLRAKKQTQKISLTSENAGKTEHYEVIEGKSIFIITYESHS